MAKNGQKWQKMAKNGKNGQKWGPTAENPQKCQKWHFFKGKMQKNTFSGRGFQAHFFGPHTPEGQNSVCLLSIFCFFCKNGHF